MIFIRRLLAIAVILALASCGGTERRSPPQPTPVDEVTSPFLDTLKALGTPLKAPPGRVILVNIPSYELVALEEGQPVFRSRVIVGKPETRTPRIDTKTRSIIFWPSWRPTPDMVASGEVPDRIFPPGPGNPMGLLAITLDTRLGIAMHDTNQRSLFAEDRRAFSHGCIRVQKWERLAAWLLGRDEDWVKQMAGGPSTQSITAPPVPVLIRYYTVFPSEDGRVVRHPDVYELGAASTVSLNARKFLGQSDAEFRPDRACRIVQ